VEEGTEHYEEGKGEREMNTNKECNNEDGYISLGYAIIEQAVEDLKMLQSNKLIINGKVQKWPTRKGVYVNKGGYNHPHEAKELVLWFNNGSLDELLAMLGSPVDKEAMCQKLGV
jgi:hypothetical protein